MKIHTTNSQCTYQLITNSITKLSATGQNSATRQAICWSGFWTEHFHLHCILWFSWV